MNIQLLDSHLVPSGIDTDEGKYFIVTDTIGFSTANLVEGFNRADQIFEDVNTLVYPKLDEAVLILLPYLNKFSEDIVEAPVTTSIERANEAITDPVTPYEDIAYAHQITHIGEGWYTVYGFLLDTTVQLTGVYYDTTLNKIIDVDNNVTLDIVDLLERTDVQSADIHTFITVQMEQKLHELVGDLADISMLKGVDCKEYASKQRIVHLWEGQISGAHTLFNDGLRTRAQQVIEDLENTDPTIEF